MVSFSILLYIIIPFLNHGISTFRKYYIPKFKQVQSDIVCKFKILYHYTKIMVEIN